MIRRLFPLLAIAAVFVFVLAGCGDDDSTNPIAVALKAISVSSAPVIDGSADAVWNSAEAFIIQAGANASYNDDFGVVDLTLKAVTYGNNLYVLAQWQDPSSTEHNRRKEWSFDNGTWTKSGDNEDRCFLLFDAGNGTQKADCSSMCHGAEMYTDGGNVDVWHWKATRTNAGSPGRADDKWWGGVGIGRGSDAKDASWYTDNTQEVGGNDIPKYMHSTGTSFNGHELFDADKADFDANLDWTGKTLPYYVTNTSATGSRWDVQAKGVYANGTWTVEFCRALNTGNADDVVLGGGTIEMTAAITDNSGGEHSGTEVFELQF